MKRTRLRPLPDGRLGHMEAMVLAAVLSVAGLLILGFGANMLSAGVALAALLSYTAVYTHEEAFVVATVIGAILAHYRLSSAGPRRATAVAGRAWVLFGIVFLWRCRTSSPLRGSTGRTTRKRDFRCCR